VEKGRLHYGWIVVITGFLVTVGAHGFGRLAYTIILPAMRDGLHLNYTQLGLLGTGNFVGYLIMALVGGMLAARFGTRLVIALALLLMGLTMLLTGLAQGFGWALAMRFLTGLGNGASYVPAMALGSAWFAVKRRGFATGIVSAGIGGGIMISGIIVPPILAHYGPEGWRFAWYYLGGLVLLIAGAAAVLIRNHPEDLGLCQVGDAGPAPAPNKHPNSSSGLNWASIYKVGAIWHLAMVYGMFGFAYIIYATFFAAYLVKQMGQSPAMAGGLWALAGALSIFCGMIWGYISDKLGRGRGLALGYLVQAFSYLIFALVPNAMGFYLSAAIFGLSAWSIPTIMAAAAGDHVGPRLAPAGLGFITLGFAFGQTLGPGVGGYLADLTGSFTLPFLVAGGASLLGSALSLGIGKKQAGPAGCAG
jgi:MFS family permease